MTPQEQLVALLRSAGRALGLATSPARSNCCSTPGARSVLSGARRADGEGRGAASRGRDPRAAPRRVPRAYSTPRRRCCPTRSRGRLGDGSPRRCGSSRATRKPGCCRGRSLEQMEKRAAPRRQPPGGRRVPARRSSTAVPAGCEATGADPPPRPREQVRASRQDPADDESDLLSLRRALRRASRAAPSACAAGSRTGRRRPTRPSR